MNNEELVAAQREILESLVDKAVPKPLTPEQLLDAEKRHWLNVAAVNSLAYFIQYAEENLESTMDVGQRQDFAARESIGYALSLVEKLYSHP